MKAIVEIKLDDSRNQYSEDELNEMFGEDCPEEGYIAIDERELQKHPDDDSFFLFKLIRWEK